jgi:uncharacterized protein (DUF1778 family)
MTTAASSPFQIVFPISPEQRELLEQAAAQSGQSLDEFAAFALVEKARQVVQNGSVRVLSERDARRFLELLDVEAEPNDALRAAAEQYGKRHA